MSCFGHGLMLRTGDGAKRQWRKLEVEARGINA